MFNERGLAAYILTLHPGALGFAALAACFVALALYVVTFRRTTRERIALSLVLFVGCTILIHVGLSSLAGVDALSVEVVRGR